VKNHGKSSQTRKYLTALLCQEISLEKSCSLAFSHPFPIPFRHFGLDVIRRLLDGVRPGWESDLRMSRERHLCHVSAGHEAAMTVSC
jgi:hypothetical protein